MPSRESSSIARRYSSADRPLRTPLHLEPVAEFVDLTHPRRCVGLAFRRLRSYRPPFPESPMAASSARRGIDRQLPGDFLVRITLHPSDATCRSCPSPNSRAGPRTLLGTSATNSGEALRRASRRGHQARRAHARSPPSSHGFRPDQPDRFTRRYDEQHLPECVAVVETRETDLPMPRAEAVERRGARHPPRLAAHPDGGTSHRAGRDDSAKPTRAEMKHVRFRRLA